MMISDSGLLFGPPCMSLILVRGSLDALTCRTFHS